MRTGTDPCAESLIFEQRADGGAELCGIARIMQQQTTDSIFNLIADSADLTGHHRTRLPHRLGYGETEPFRKTLLNDDGGSPLQRVHHQRILLFVIHRKTCQVHSSPCARRQELPGPCYLGVDLGPLGVIVNALHIGAGKQELRVAAGEELHSRNLP